MYWSRTGSIVELLAWLVMSGLWWTGGWLLIGSLFSPRQRESLFVGGASGFLLFIVFSNLLAQFISLPVAYWSASMLILILGLIAAQQSAAPLRLRIAELQVWPQILAFAGILLLFSAINHGLAIFDDYSNIPLVSIIATGDVPPHFILNPGIILDYHYGLHLFAASMVRVGGFFPWSAFDFSKSLTLAITLVLIWLWFNRFFNKRMAVLLGVLLILFGGGTRWVLLFVPADTLKQMGSGLHMLGSAMQTGPDLYSALASPWKIEGGGPIPFPFAFTNGMFSSLLALGGSGASSQLTLFLLLLLAKRKWQPWQGIIYGLLIASLALTVELLFVMVWSGILVAAIIRLWRYRPSLQTFQWGWVLGPSAILAFSMGGVISSTVHRLFSPGANGASPGGVSLPGITYYWPPAFLSAHLGALSLANPSQVLIALAEMGPVVLLAPWVTWLAWEYIRSRKLLMAGLSILAILGFLIPLFVKFVDRERDISRMTGSALTIWMVLGFPYVWFIFRKSTKWGQFFIGASLAATMLGGIALLMPELVAIARPQLSYFIQEPDARISKAFWDKLDKDAQILDLHFLYRPPTLFGRSAGRASQSWYITLPAFRALAANPDAVQIAQYGYSYVYFDRDSWQGLTPEQRQTFQQPCVKVVSEQKTPLGDFRRLLDVRTCQKAPNSSVIQP